MPQALDRLNRATSRWSPRQLARRALVGCMPRRRLVESLPGTGAIYLTFDDGPHPEHTPRVLDILREHNAHATFFVIGQECERHPNIVRRIVAEGHSIGNHTYTHLDARQASPAVFAEEIARTNRILESLVGAGTSLVRPPYGALRLRTLLQLWQAGHVVVLWNVDPKDYQCSGEGESRAWFAEHPIGPGDIVLLHDNQQHTSSVVANLLRTYQERGARFDRLPHVEKLVRST